MRHVNDSWKENFQGNPKAQMTKSYMLFSVSLIYYTKNALDNV